MPIHCVAEGDHLLVITIDRPERKNAMDLHHFRDLARAWRDFRDDDDLWVAIITGTDGCFMAGADLKDYVPQITALSAQIAAGEVDEIDGCKLSDGTEAVLRNVKLYKPIIAAIDGPCVAGGMEMLGGIDIRLATPRATFGVLEPKRGLFAGGGTTARLPRQLPYAAAMEFLLTAEAFPASRALELGLLNEVVEPDRLMERAHEWAQRILANGPLAVRATKESVVRGMSGTLREAYKIESEISGIVFQSDDAKEGPKAFAEKRPPNWTNRCSSACLIGWSQVSRLDGEPLTAWAEALRSTGVDPAAVDSLDVVYCQSWPYDDPAGRLAEAVGATPARAAYSGIGGTTPLQLLIDAAERIESGQAEVCAVVGGEALGQVRAFKKAGERPPWSHRDPERKPFPFEAPFHPAEVAVELYQAYSTFAMRDVARRAGVGLGVDEHRQALGDLFAPMTKVAATNPHAWFPHEWTTSDLIDVSTENRMVAYPYTKRLVAVMDVDLAAAVVIASSEAADRLGVPTDQRVHLRGWASATDPVYVAEHDDLGRSPGMAWAFEQALTSSGVGIDDISHADLYSCFPSSVQFALDALGLRADDRPAPFTVTGGLPYAGGAGSCYLLSALAAMADRLVDDRGSLGLVSGVGMHMTKHVASVLSVAPGVRKPAPPDPGPAIRRPIVDVHRGEAAVATYTVHHGRDGAATDAVLICDVPGSPDGARCYARAWDAELLAALEAEEWVGRSLVLTDGGNGVNRAEEAR